MVGCGPWFLIQWSICHVTEVKGEYQQEEEELDNFEDVEEPDCAGVRDVVFL